MGRSGRWLVLLTLSIAGGFFAGRVYWTLQKPEPPPTPGTGTVAVSRLPEVRLHDLDGQVHSFSEWSSRSLVVNFWATWCAPCRKEMPLLEQLHQQHAGADFAVIGIAIDREEPVRSFIAETGVSYPILIGEEDAMAAAEALSPQFVGLPLTVISAPGGDILKVQMGELHAEDLTRIVEVLDSLAAGKLSLAEARQALETARDPTGA